MYNNSTSNTLWQHIDKFIVFLYMRKTVINPVVFEMLVNLLVKTIWQWLVLTETGQ